MSYTIRRAAGQDVPTLHAMADRFLLSQLSAPERDARGFLVSNFSLDRYRRFVDDADYFYVLEDEGGIAGFVLAYGSDRIGPDETVNRTIADRHPAPFVLIKQICIAPERGGRGYARRLYDHVLEASGGLPQFAAVVLEPLNQPSVAFHERLGFREVFQIVAPDGLPRGIYGR